MDSCGWLDRCDGWAGEGGWGVMGRCGWTVEHQWVGRCGWIRVCAWVGSCGWVSVDGWVCVDVCVGGGVCGWTGGCQPEPQPLKFTAAYYSQLLHHLYLVFRINSLYTHSGGELGHCKDVYTLYCEVINYFTKHDAHNFEWNACLTVL